MKRFLVLTLFPEVFSETLSASLLGKAQEKGLVDFQVLQIRDFATDKHKSVDDTLFGGAPGMLLKVDVLHRAWSHAKNLLPHSKTILMSPQGPVLNQTKCNEFAAQNEGFILVCGHYEGVDERFIELCVDQEVSIGDYVLTGGEFAALVFLDAVTRQIAGVVGDSKSLSADSLWNGSIKEPVYTRPREFMGKTVPEVLLSGNHAEIEKWSKQQSEMRTKTKRPDLWEKMKK